MRDLMLLPVIAAAWLLLIPPALMVLAFAGVVLLLGEKQGWARLGGLHQDDRDC